MLDYVCKDQHCVYVLYSLHLNTYLKFPTLGFQWFVAFLPSTSIQVKRVLLLVTKTPTYLKSKHNLKPQVFVCRFVRTQRMCCEPTSKGKEVLFAVKMQPPNTE